MNVENVQTQTQNKTQSGDLQWLYDLVRYKSLSRAEYYCQLEEERKKQEEELFEQAVTVIAETIKRVYGESDFARYLDINENFAYFVLLKVISSSKLLNFKKNRKRMALALARIYNKDPHDVYNEIKKLGKTEITLTEEEQKLKEKLENELLRLDVVEDFRIKIAKLEQLVEILNVERKKNKLIIYLDDKDSDCVEIRLDRLLTIETRHNYDVFVVNKNVITQLYLFFRRNNINVSAVLEDPREQLFLARNPESSRYLRLIEMLLKKAKEAVEEREFIKELKMLEEIYKAALQNELVVSVTDADALNTKKVDLNKVYESDNYLVFTSFLASRVVDEFEGFSIIIEKKERMRKKIAGRRLSYVVYYINKKELADFIDFDKLKEEYAKAQRAGDEAIEEFIKSIQSLRETLAGGDLE